MKLKIPIILILFIFLTGCGFKVVDQNYFKQYRIMDAEILGDKRVVYLLQNKLKVDNKNASKTIKMIVETENVKKIKEKNIQNEITKYEISISTKVEYEVIENKESGEFYFTKRGDFSVSDRYSITLNNEKELIKNLINDISAQIFKNLRIKLDDY